MEGSVVLMNKSGYFNAKDMEEKITKNNLKGFSIKQIHIMLNEELLENRKQVLTLDQRASELQDQIIYITDKYGDKL